MFMVNQVESTIHVTDSQSPLSPQAEERIVQRVLACIREQHRHELAAAEERKMRPSMTARETSLWEG
jgi:hypothetical protein